MKKLFMLSLSGFLIHFSFSQITSTDYGNIGDTVYNGWKFNTTVPPGSPGSGQTWDFTGIGMDIGDFVYFVNPALVPGSSNFPSANMATTSYNDGIRFLEKAPGYLKYHGGLEAGAFATATNYSPALDWIQFPATLGTTFNTSSYSDAITDQGIDTTIFSCVILIDSIRTKRVISLDVNFDASGQIFLPTDTFWTSFRATNTTIKQDSVFIFCPNGISGIACTAFGINYPVGWSELTGPLAGLAGINNGTVDTSHSYLWYAPGEKYPVCNLEQYTSTSPIIGKYRTDYIPSTAGVNENKMIPSRIYPNPASDFIKLEYHEAFKNADITIYSMEGKVMMTTNLNSASNLDVRLFNPGNYFYVIRNENNKTISSGKLLIKR